MDGPLRDVKVLDVSRILSGPFCTMLLADMGADVVKVERPPTGDLARRLGPLIGDDTSYFVSVNRGKRSVGLDIFEEGGREAFKQLAAKADVLVENYAPGTLAQLGLDYAELARENPRLIYASITGFGQEGPYAQMPALDAVVQAMGGLMSVTGELGGAPLRPGVSLGDSLAGLFAALSITTALYQRSVTGRGQYIDTAMLDCQVTLMENPLGRYFATGEVPGRIGSRHPAAAPFQTFDTTDGQVVVALLSDDPELWRGFCVAIEHPTLADDSRFSDNRARVANRAALEEVLDAAFARQTTEEWLRRLSAAHIPAGPVTDVGQLAEDPQVVSRRMIAEIPHAQLGTWRVANTPFRFSEAETGPAGPSPRLGEHTDAVLADWLGDQA